MGISSAKPVSAPPSAEHLACVDRELTDPSVMWDRAKELQDKDPCRAKFLCEKILQLQSTHTGAMVCLGKMLIQGRGLWERSSEASVLFRKASDRDNSEGMVQLAKMFCCQTASDRSRAIDLDIGISEAEKTLKAIREKRRLPKHPDPEILLRSLRISTSPKEDDVLDPQILLEVDRQNTQALVGNLLPSDASACIMTDRAKWEEEKISRVISSWKLLKGFYFSRAQMFRSESKLMLQRAACLSNVDAKVILSGDDFHLTHGDRGPLLAYDHSTTLEMLRSFALLGNVSAMRTLAQRYLDEDGPYTNLEVGKRLLVRAAELNDGEAVEELAYHYVAGNCGFEKNTHTAFKLFEKAVFELGRQQILTLKEMYSKGEGGPKDQREAHRLHILRCKSYKISSS